jgi:hypothetical protein
MPRVRVVGLADYFMADPQPKEETRATFDFVHDEISILLLELSDLMESGAIPTQDGISALRAAAGLVSLIQHLSA